MKTAGQDHGTTYARPYTNTCLIWFMSNIIRKPVLNRHSKLINIPAHLSFEFLEYLFIYFIYSFVKCMWTIYTLLGNDGRYIFIECCFHTNKNALIRNFVILFVFLHALEPIDSPFQTDRFIFAISIGLSSVSAHDLLDPVYWTQYCFKLSTMWYLNCKLLFNE